MIDQATQSPETWITYLNRDGKDSIPLGGPYPSLDAAKADADRIRKMALVVDPFTHFDRLRSARVAGDLRKPLFGNTSDNP